MPKDFRERVKGIAIRFEDKPSAALLDQGVPEEAFTTTSRDGKEITVFLMNLFERHGKRPGEFNEELRKVMLAALGCGIGTDLSVDE
ncbi:MAG: hypothetical protein K8T26_01545 [Lentisphaerae bacterium]|nr:hypothetical protein [Lentisphaerota bacterium]